MSVWAVKVRKTGCRVGTLRMAIRDGRERVEFARCPPFDLEAAMLGETGPAQFKKVVVDFDRAAAVAWVERADSLIGLGGYELD